MWCPRLQVRKGLFGLSQVTLGCCSLIMVSRLRDQRSLVGVLAGIWGRALDCLRDPLLPLQSAIPAILTPTPGSPEALQLAEFHTSTIATLQVSSHFMSLLTCPPLFVLCFRCQVAIAFLSVIVGCCRVAVGCQVLQSLGLCSCFVAVVVTVT